MLELYNKGNYFNLYVLDFEFAESKYQEDLDWINIEIDVNYNTTTWTAKGAYLTIKEISKIETWFNHISNFSIKKERLDFFENEIAFEFNKSQNILSIILDFNFHPKGKHYDYSKDKEFKIAFPITSKEVYKILQNIKKTTTYLLETR